MNTLTALKLARQLMDEHGLSDWEFVYDKAYKRFGACYHYRRRISLSRKLTELNDESKVRETILHEIAHALVPSQHGHDDVWRAMALAIGSNGKSKYSASDVVMVSAPFIGTCPNPKCSFKIEKHRRSRGSCPLCSGGRFNPHYLIEWKRR